MKALGKFIKIVRFNNKAKNKKYRSSSEEKFADNLRLNNIKFKYESELIEYTITKIRRYKPDFIIHKTRSKKIYLEVKGWFTGADRVKLLQVKQSNPKLDIRIIFEANNKLSKTSQTRYSDWAIKHGFKFHIGLNVPEDWVEEMYSKEKSSNGE